MPPPLIDLVNVGDDLGRVKGYLCLVGCEGERKGERGWKERERQGEKGQKNKNRNENTEIIKMRK